MKTPHKILISVLIFIIIGLFLLAFSCVVHAVDTDWVIDLFNQGGGKGKNVDGAPCFLGERIVLYAHVTYKGIPAQSVLVSFQVNDPQNRIISMNTAQTNSSGYATINFTITKNVYPIYPSLWTAIVSTSPTQDTIMDVMAFYIISPVGGDCISVQKVFINLLFVQISIILLMVPIGLLKKHNNRRLSHTTSWQNSASVHIA